MPDECTRQSVFCASLIQQFRLGPPFAYRPVGAPLGAFGRTWVKSAFSTFPITAAVNQDLLNLRRRAKWAYHLAKNTLEMENGWRDTPLRFLWAGALAMTQKKSETGDLLRDTLDMLVLKTLTRGEMHGYDIAEYIHERSEQVLGVEEGALYPALHRLELRGLLAAEWGASDNNRRAKYYRLTAAGRKQLAEETAHWKRMSSAIARILEPA